MYYETISLAALALVFIAILGCLASHWIGCWLDKGVIKDDKPGCFKMNERLP
jgi:hypothetical protein